MSKRPTRMEQLGALLTTMVYVVVSGSSDLTLNSDSESETPKERDPRSSGLLAVPPDILREFLPEGKYRGTLSRIAQRLEVNHASVSAILHGRQHSRRIASALLAEIALIDGTEIASESITSSDTRFQPFTKAQIAEFKHGGRYNGAQQRIHQDVSRVVRGKRRSDGVICAIRREMRRVDAALITKNGGRA